MPLHVRQLPFVLPLALLAGCAPGPGTSSIQQVAYSPFADSSGVAFSKIATPSDLAKMVGDIGGAQQKFETDADFNLRMKKLKPFEVCKSVSETSLKFDSSTGSAIYKEWLYDAQISGYREKNGETFSDPAVFMPDLDASFGSKKIGEYAGQNSFGATAVVEIRKADTVHLVFDPIFKSPLTFPHPYIEADARSLVAVRQKAFLCVTAIPTAPFYRQSVFHSSPTLAHPYEGEVTHHFFRVKIGSIRLSDDKGNTIPGQVSVSPGV